MKLDPLQNLLRADLQQTPVERAGSGFFVPLAEPRPLAPLLETCLETDDERERYAGTFAQWPGNVAELLGEAGWLQPLLTFNWLGFGPFSSSAGLGLVGRGDEAWLVWWDEWVSYRAVAALSAAADPTVVSAAARAHIANDPVFPEPIQFGSLPSTTFSYDEELLPEEVVRAAYVEHLDNPKRGFTDWRAFVDEYLDSGTQPDHLERCLSLLRRAAVPDGAEDPDGLGELGGDESAGPPSAAVCKAVFESWWKGAYQGW